MKIPKRPPDWPGLFRKYASDFPILMQVMRSVNGPTLSDKYLHWDDIRHRTPPEGLTPEQWWLGIKLARSMQRKEIPLRDKNGGGFFFVLADSLAEALPDLDSSAKGIVGLPEAIANPETKTFYLIRSLMEEAITSSQLEGAATTGCSGSAATIPLPSGWSAT